MTAETDVDYLFECLTVRTKAIGKAKYYLSIGATEKAYKTLVSSNQEVLDLDNSVMPGGKHAR